MKKISRIAILCIGHVLFGQVGINTPEPKASLDIMAKTSTGTTTSPEGLLIPRVDRQKAQSMTGVEISTVIYVNNIATGTLAGTAINIDAIGYYYFNGTAWIKLNANIYNSNGTLTGNRTVTQGANTLAFTANQTNAFSVGGTTFSVDALNRRVGIGSSSPTAVLTAVNPGAGSTVDVFTAGINNCGAPCGQNTARNITLFNVNGTNSQFAGIEFIPANNANGITGAAIRGIDRDYTNGYAGLQFFTRNATDFAARVTLKASGNLGIGTTNPAARLEVRSGGSPATPVPALKIVDGTQGVGKVLTSDGNGLATWQTATSTNIYSSNGALTENRIVTQDANTLAFTGSAVNAFSVDGTTLSVDAANNRVGIGTATPQNRIDLGADAPTSVSDVTGKKLAVLNNAAGTSFYGLGVSSNTLQLHAASAATASPGMVLTDTGNVGVGTATPNAYAILDVSSTTKGFLPPKMTTTQRNAINIAKPTGLTIYNTDMNCMQYWNGNEWRGDCQGDIQTLTCSTGSTGTLKIGSDVSGVTSTVSYTGGNGGAYNMQIIQSTGVEGLTATLTSGNFVNGNGTLTYFISGTPRSTGTASFVINLGGKTCTITRNVECFDTIGKTEGAYPNPFDNTKYYQITKVGSTYTPFCFTCPSGNVYDPSTQLCTAP